MVKIVSNSEKDTSLIGRKLGELLNQGDIVCMSGDLGAGKTTISKSIAKGLGINEDVTSPTFTLINEYEGRLPMYHFDVYRLGDVEEFEDLGYEEYFYGEGVCIVEWAKKIIETLPEDCLWLNMKRIDENRRELTFEGNSQRYNHLIEEMKKYEDTCN